MHKLTLGIVIPILIFIAPKTYALTHTERFNFGFSDGEQQATTDFLNHSPFNSACDPTGAHTSDGKHTMYYCDGWFKGYSTTWNNLAQANAPANPQPAQEPLKQASEVKLPSITSHVNVSSTSPSMRDATNNATISIHTVNTILGSNNNVLIQKEPILRKLIVANINNAVLMAEGSIKDKIPVNVNTKIINQLANRISTTQGIDFTKELVVTELVNAINAIKTKGNTPLVVDNLATCTGISPPTNPVCALTINIRS
ncbi:MAG: hypothetical protein WBZ36_22955 [Candidatus Nitrosopolaris sp.]